MRNVICRFRVPHKIVVNNGPQLKMEQITKFWDNLHIAMSPTSISHPQTNNQTKATNKKILTSIKIRLEDAKGLWVEELLITL